MIKFRRFIWIIIIIILLILCLLAFNVRKSFIKDTDVNLYINDKNILYTPEEYEEDITKVFTKNKDISNLKQLENISPIIVKVKIDDNSPREMYEETTLTKVIVKKVFKGKLDKKSIYVFEPFDVYSSERILYSLDGYNIMNENSEYILFLRDIKDSTYTSDNSIYMPTTTLLSKFTVDNKELGLNNYQLTSNGIKYNNVKKLDIISNNEKDIEKYNTMKHDVLNKYTNILK